MTKEAKMLAVVEAMRRAIAEWDSDGEMDVSPMRAALADLDAHTEADAEMVEVRGHVIWNDAVGRAGDDEVAKAEQLGRQWCEDALEAQEQVTTLRAELAAAREALRIAIVALDAADMPHTADAIRTALGDTP